MVVTATHVTGTEKITYVIDDVVTVKAGTGCSYPSASDHTKVSCTVTTLDSQDPYPTLQLTLGNGNDTISTTGDAADGGAGNDVITGGAGAQSLTGGTGNDRIHGGAGNDFIYSGTGNDVLYGDAGADTIYGNSGNDTLWGGTGTDTLSGGPGRNVVHQN